MDLKEPLKLSKLSLKGTNISYLTDTNISKSYKYI